MITLTRLTGPRHGAGGQFAVNPDLIERVHAAPDTTVVMIDGATYIVTEPLSVVVDLIVAFRARVLAAALTWTEES